MIATVVGGIVLFVLLAIDLFTKAWAYAAKVAQSGYFLGFIRLNYLPGGNKGIAFGWFGDTPTAMVIITVFTVAMILGIGALYFTVFKKNTPARICLAVIEAGAIGNFIDRVCLGYVRDFVDVQPIGFGICNFADFYITFGAVAFLIVILFIGTDAIIPVGKWRKEKSAAPTAETAELDQIEPDKTESANIEPEQAEQKNAEPSEVGAEGGAPHHDA